ncbi:hypothetical protein HNW13_018295 [Shewanella sp. BF02_Schw]|uniref:hypothetical protein n=1 Tax=Shewanella sp. BF02_Schw TaxID=394908 RepID=UPI00178491D5|nr:hypothetical protein [Shewanella sp. BF02_Schw]MBO1897692.1 hypothetical protein [Shewanella sp. BF02_Schw]
MEIAEFGKDVLEQFKHSTTKLSIELDKPLCMRDQVAIISDVSGVPRQDVINTLKALSGSIFFQLMNEKLTTVRIEGLITYQRIIKKPRKEGKRRINDGTEITIKSQPAKHDVITKQQSSAKQLKFPVNTSCDKKLRKIISDELEVK